jgi:hypothetical protein
MYKNDMEFCFKYSRVLEKFGLSFKDIRQMGQTEFDLLAEQVITKYHDKMARQEDSELNSVENSLRNT